MKQVQQNQKSNFMRTTLQSFIIVSFTMIFLRLDAQKEIYNWDNVGTELSKTLGFANVLAVSPENELFVGGHFPNLASQLGENYSLIKWDGETWQKVGEPGIVNKEIQAIAFDGNDIYIGGGFSELHGNNSMARIAKWDGSSWKSVGGGLNRLVKAIHVHETGIYVGGDFTNAGGDEDADYIIRWDGEKWNALGSGENQLKGNVLDIKSKGMDIYVGGRNVDFVDILTGNQVEGIGRWDGNFWHGLTENCEIPIVKVEAILVHGDDLYLGGDMMEECNNFAKRIPIIRYDGEHLYKVGNDISVPAPPVVNAIEFFNGQLYIGGNFQNAGGNQSADNIARLEGDNWTNLCDGLAAPVNSMVKMGGDLFVGGGFMDVGGINEADRVVRWGVSDENLDRAFNFFCYLYERDMDPRFFENCEDNTDGSEKECLISIGIVDQSDLFDYYYIQETNTRGQLGESRSLTYYYFNCNFENTLTCTKVTSDFFPSTDWNCDATQTNPDFLNLTPDDFIHILLQKENIRVELENCPSTSNPSSEYCLAKESCQTTVSTNGIRNYSRPIKIYPNPSSSDQINIELEKDGKAIIHIYNGLGVRVGFNFTQNGNTIYLQTQSLANGVYFIAIDQAENQYFQEFIIQK